MVTASAIFYSPGSFGGSFSIHSDYTSEAVWKQQVFNKCEVSEYVSWSIHVRSFCLQRVWNYFQHGLLLTWKVFRDNTIKHIFALFIELIKKEEEFNSWTHKSVFSRIRQMGVHFKYDTMIILEV